MGEVFLARQEGPAGFSRPAVVKRVLAHLAREPEFVQMFLDEARLAGNLAHPNIVQIFELGEADGTWFIAMEYLHGRSLRLVREKVAAQGEAMNPVQAARILSQVLDGLQYAHTLKSGDGAQLEVVHRDVSDDNVFVGFNGGVKVLDFGIAKAANAIATTRAGMVKGKCAYMSPEQLLGHKLDGRADVYSAGVVLYELLSGQRPFTATTDTAVINLVMTAPVPPLQQRAPRVPAALCDLVMKALAKSRENRWATAGEFSQALDRFIVSTGEPNNNASTAEYLKRLFGEVALEPEPGLPPPSPSAPRPIALEARPPQQGLGTRELEMFESPAAGPLEAEAPLELDRPAPAPQPVEPAAAARPRWVFPAVAAVLLALVATGALYLSRRDAGRDLAMTVPELTFSSEPAGARLRIGENEVGKTPWVGSNVWTGEVGWELEAPGYQRKLGTLKGGQRVDLKVKMLKK